MTDKILIDRSVVEQALEAFDVATTPLARDRQEVLRAIEELRAALEQPQTYPLPDDLYGGSKDWRAGSYADRVEWLHVMYESAKEQIAALEQPVEQEPVAWAETDANGEIVWNTDSCFSDDPDWLENPTALYTHPKPPRKPLTDDEISDLFQNQNALPRLVKFIRVIEAAHSIGGEK